MGSVEAGICRRNFARWRCFDPQQSESLLPCRRHAAKVHTAIGISHSVGAAADAYRDCAAVTMPGMLFIFCQFPAAAPHCTVTCDIQVIVVISIVMTHAEAADLDDYGPATTFERWDLWKLASADGTLQDGGALIRSKAKACCRVGGTLPKSTLPSA